MGHLWGLSLMLAALRLLQLPPVSGEREKRVLHCRLLAGRQQLEGFGTVQNLSVPHLKTLMEGQGLFFFFIS